MPTNTGSCGIFWWKPWSSVRKFWATHPWTRKSSRCSGWFCPSIPWNHTRGYRRYFHGRPESVREKNLKCLIVLGATDDALPGITGSVGIFTDEERRILNELGLELKGGDDEEICRQLYNVYAALTKPVRKLIVTYPQSSGDSKSRPSHVAERIAAIFNIKPVREPELGMSLKPRRRTGLSACPFGQGQRPAAGIALAAMGMGRQAGGCKAAHTGAERFPSPVR